MKEQEQITAAKRRGRPQKDISGNGSAEPLSGTEDTVESGDL